MASLRSREQMNTLFFRFFAAMMVLVVILIGPATAKQNPKILYQSLPGWVLDMNIPDTNKLRLRSVHDGIYHLIDDTQIKVGEAGSDYFLRTTRKTVGRSGLESAAQIQMEFDPETDDLVLHRAAVWRDGKMIDQTATASVEIMRRENELEEGIVTGRRTANLRLADVRVGDITDFAWSVNEKHSYWPGHFFGQYDLVWSVPVAATRLRVLFEPSLDLNTQLTNGAPLQKETTANGFKVLTWTVLDPDPLATEDKTPKWLKQSPSVELSTISGWADVVNWERPLYEVDPFLPPGLVDKVDTIASGSSDLQIRASQALQLVQDSVRYTSLSIGLGGFRPRAPAVTWKSGFGDCKDKTALLIAILQRLDIKAAPALTDTVDGPGLNTLQPRINAFNHVIVRVEGLGDPIWLDPTGSHEGGIIPNIADQTYGYALPLRSGQTKLEKIATPTPKNPTIVVGETHVRSSKGVVIDIQTTYKGDEANIKRASIAGSSLTSIEMDEIEYYKGLYPGVEQKGPLQVSDDRQKNILVVEQRYFLPATANEYEDTIIAYAINAWAFHDLYDTPDASERKTAYSLPYQINRRHIFKLTTPGMKPDLPSDKTISGKAFEFSRTSIRDGENATIEMDLIGKTSLLEAADVAAYREDAEKLADLSYEYIDLDDEFGLVGLSLFFIAFAVALVGGIALLYFAVHALKAAESAGTVSGQFRPVGILKLLILCFSTFNIYLFYWFWRCWRRYQQTEGVDISPFWRAFFSIFWVFELFKVAREKADLKKPIWIGIAASIGYFLFTILYSVADRFDLSFGMELAASMAATVVIIPIVQQVNSANDENLVAKNSRFYTRDWLAICVGLPCSLMFFAV